MGGGGVVLGHPAMWAFIVVKFVIDMACMVHMHATSVILWWCHLLGTTTIMVMTTVDVMDDVLVHLHHH